MSIAVRLQLDPSLVTWNASHSVLRYLAAEDEDFGTLVCAAHNDLGVTDSPCVIKIIPAGKADT